jgi:GNAT superfamily N-acetyltransferase
MQWHKGEYWITTDPDNVDLDAVQRLLNETYWAKNRSPEQVAATVNNSMIFSLFRNGEQIGFARVVTDKTVFALIADVVIAPQYRRHGLGTWLMQCVAEHPLIRRCLKLLRTRDAHGLYERLGFRRTEWMDSPPQSDGSGPAALSWESPSVPKDAGVGI